MPGGLEKRGNTGGWSWRLRPFGSKQVRITIPVASKVQARRIQLEIQEAFDLEDFSLLSNAGEVIARQVFEKSGHSLPRELNPTLTRPQDLTLLDAAKLFLNYPTVRGIKPTVDPVTGKRVRNHPVERHTYAVTHFINFFGPEKRIKDLWVPEIRAYCDHRFKEVTEATVNRELSSISKFFRVMIEQTRMTGISSNPVSLVESSSEKLGERVVYISSKDFRIFEECCSAPVPGCSGVTRFGVPWLRAIAQLQFYAGLRVGEALNLKKGQVALEERLIHFGPQHVKEKDRKKVPIHLDLLPILERLVSDCPAGEDRLVLIRDSDGKGTRPPSEDSLKNPWRSIMDLMGLHPRPRLTDLRHTWRRNARRSKIDEYIAESLLGHWTAASTVNRRYGRWIEGDELLESIDELTFDHGETHIFVPRACDQFVTNGEPTKEKGHAAT